MHENSSKSQGYKNEYYLILVTNKLEASIIFANQ